MFLLLSLFLCLSLGIAVVKLKPRRNVSGFMSIEMLGSSLLGNWKQPCDAELLLNRLCKARANAKVTMSRLGKTVGAGVESLCQRLLFRFGERLPDFCEGLIVFHSQYISRANTC